MATILDGISRTFSEYLLIPNLTKKDCTPDRVSLRTPLVRFRKGTTSALHLNMPLTSAIMQAVSGPELAIALARCGGISFIYGSQSIESQAEMIRKVKKYKAGFVVSDSNLMPDATFKNVLELKKKNGHSTVAITDDGTPTGTLLGLLTSRDYHPDAVPLQTKVSELMTPLSSLVCATEGVTLKEANALIRAHKLDCLPVIRKQGQLVHFVFRKDYDAHRENPEELLDSQKRLLVGAGINTRDYEERVPALVEAGADALCIDSSDGYTEWQQDTLTFIKSHYGDSVRIGAGNVVDAEGFRFLADCGADFIKVGIGGGSICITREQKGIGRGQATALLEVAAARDAYFEKTGQYIPICSDGAIVHDYHITLALAMGANFVMMGRYFARFDESPTKRIKIRGNYFKEYWGEGANRARNWERYDLGGQSDLAFEEGVDSYVPYAGTLRENVGITLHKVCSTMSNCGAHDIDELQRTARLAIVSATSIVEGGAHDVILKDKQLSTE